MPAGDVETCFHGTEWHSRIQDESGPFHTSDTKERAVDTERDEARRREVEQIIKNKDGQIDERNTYGHDAHDVKG